MQNIGIFVIIALASRCVTSKKILLVTSQIRSHFLERAAVSEVLVRRGHDVYALVSTAFPKGDELIGPGVKALHYQTDPNIEPIDAIVARSIEADETTHVSNGLTPFCRALVEDRELRRKVEELQFDLALVDGFEFNYCAFLLPYLHKIPYAMIFSRLHPWISRSPALPSFYPIGHYQGDLPFNDHMNFVQRLENVYWFVKTFAFINYPGRNDVTLFEEFAPEVKSWEDLAHESVLFIQTRDHMLDWPVSAMSNFITTPGVTTKPAKPLPENTKQIMEKSDGVIFVSFGSIASRFPTEILDNLIAALNQVEATVIWSLSRESVDYVTPKIGSHVHVLSWVPQNDILGHNKTKLFVTHCGNNGQYEALYHGVPMVGLPIFGEQPHNAFRIQDHGYGVSLLSKTLLSFSPNDLLGAIQEVSSNPKYKEKVQKASAILQGAPMLPAETITYWLEHVMEHGHAHLRSRGMDLSWYQFFMFDILLLLLVCFIGCLLVVCLIVKCIVKCIAGTRRGRKTKIE